MARLTFYIAGVVLLCQSIDVLGQFNLDFDYDSFNTFNNNQQPNQQNQPPQSSSPATPPNFQACTSQCLVTPQYNPVCGSDGVSYPNRQRLACAQGCGLNVVENHIGTCGPSAGGK